MKIFILCFVSIWLPADEFCISKEYRIFSDVARKQQIINKETNRYPEKQGAFHLRLRGNIWDTMIKSKEVSQEIRKKKNLFQYKVFFLYIRHPFISGDKECALFGRNWSNFSMAHAWAIVYERHVLPTLDAPHTLDRTNKIQKNTVYCIWGRTGCRSCR